MATEANLLNEEIRRLIVEDVLQHTPGWGQANIAKDLHRREKIDPQVTLRVIEQMVGEELLIRDAHGCVCLPEHHE